MAIEITPYENRSPGALSEVPLQKSGSRFRGLPPRWTRRNFSSRARELSGGDAIVISIPNSGRTWVRTFLCAYFCARYEHPFSLHPETHHDSRIPRIIYTHDLYEHYTKTRCWDRIRGKFLVPPREVKRAKIILLARDPRDAFVSHYIEMTRRTAETAEELKSRPVGDVLRDPILGIGLIIETMNAWFAEFAPRPDCLLVRYEDLHASPNEQFRRVLAAVGETKPQIRDFENALAFSRFGNMRKMEASLEYDRQLLQPGDANDPESYKVRRGKIGGYVDYLDPTDVEYADKAMLALDPRFGYQK
jgi:sulfotransferase family protein